MVGYAKGPFGEGLFMFFQRPQGVPLGMGSYRNSDRRLAMPEWTVVYPSPVSLAKFADRRRELSSIREHSP